MWAGDTPSVEGRMINKYDQILRDVLAYRWFRLYLHWVRTIKTSKGRVLAKCFFWERKKVTTDAHSKAEQLLGPSTSNKSFTQRAVMRVLRRMVQEFMGQEEALRLAVKAMDTTGDGVISRDELQEGCNKGFGMALSVAELDALMAVFDEDGDGTISFDEFNRVLIKHSSQLNCKATCDAVCEKISQALSQQGVSMVNFCSISICFMKTMHA